MDAMAAWPDASEPGAANPWPSPQKAAPAQEQEPPDERDTALRWPQAWPAGLAPLRLGVMASGNGSTFEALVAACRSGYVPTVRHERLRAALVGAGCRVF